MSGYLEVKPGIGEGGLTWPSPQISCGELMTGESKELLESGKAWCLCCHYLLGKVGCGDRWLLQYSSW
jgi:hypothetical protein